MHNNALNAAHSVRRAAKAALLADSFILKKIDQLRAFRNPFSHLKPFDHPHTIGQLSLTKRMHPNEVLFQNAREPLSVMYTVAIMDW